MVKRVHIPCINRSMPALFLAVFPRQRTGLRIRRRGHFVSGNAFYGTETPCIHSYSDGKHLGGEIAAERCRRSSRGTSPRAGPSLLAQNASGEVEGVYEAKSVFSVFT